MAYSQLLRADLDTFPTPLLRDDWPEHLEVNTKATYSTKVSVAALARTAKAAGLHYGDVHNIASTFWGPSLSVVKLSFLSTAVSTFLRTFAFAQGTPCNLPVHLRPLGTNCNWGTGLWEGVVSMYASELAFNHLHHGGMAATILSDRQYFDYPSSGPNHVCYSKLIHCYHPQVLFSKFDFLFKKYVDFDMSKLQPNVTTDYATYMALMANGQGHGGDTLRDVAFDRLCDTYKEPVQGA